jgi:ankyrin repeat protein
LEDYFLKIPIQIAILILSVSITSCFRTATPDDDLVSGIVLGDIVAVQQALDHGAKVSRVYKDGTTPLMYACRELKNYHGEAGAGVAVAVKADLRSSQTIVNVQAGDAHASHSSHTVKGNRQIVELLIARGADVHAKDKEGQTALSLAIRHNFVEIAEILREAGAKE